MEEIIVISYYSGSVWIYKLPYPNMGDTAIDNWLESMGFNLDEIDYMGFNLNDINWMVNKNITINDERK